jgi:phosphoglycerate dehydrogenase-like enzyme
MGYGEVPKVLAPILAAMGAKVRHWSRSNANGDFGTVLESDIVSLHLPLTRETENLIDPRRMKPGAILVNTARGGLIDEAGLVEALASGHLAAAGLDVFREEPLPATHPLAALPNVVCAPHLAWLTRETLERSVDSAMENVRRLREGSPLLHRIA